jgi:hypothetical protein
MVQFFVARIIISIVATKKSIYWKFRGYVDEDIAPLWLANLRQQHFTFKHGHVLQTIRSLRTYQFQFFNLIQLFAQVMPSPIPMTDNEGHVRL